MANNSDDIIDLCDSFILADHHGLTNVLIELDDDSFLIDADNPIVVSPESDNSTTVSTLVSQARRQNRDKENNPLACIKQKQKEKLQSKKINNKTICNESESKFGDCPICFDALGQNPLASTTCGHVYCMKCIQQYLSFDKRCPTCRQILRGKSSYHPLYLNK